MLAHDFLCSLRSPRLASLVLTLGLVLTLVLPAFLAAQPLANDAAGAGSVTLSLEDYLELLARGDSPTDPGEPPGSVLVSHHLTVTVPTPGEPGEDPAAARVEQVLEVEMRGEPLEPMPLPAIDLPATARIEAIEDDTPTGDGTGGATLRRHDGHLELAARRPGRYRVKVEGRQVMRETPAGRQLELPPGGAPIAVATIELAAGMPRDLPWRASGAVLVEEEGTTADATGPRRLRLALPRERGTTLELGGPDRRQDEPLVARAVTVTLLDLDRRLPRRHDLVLYEVMRGGLAGHQLSLPAEIADQRPPELAATDEGTASPLLTGDDGRQWSHPRRHRLEGVGWALLTSPLVGAGTVPLPPVTPGVPVRARYLVLAGNSAGQADPLPAQMWRSVDVEDLPEFLVGPVRTLQPSAVWRLAGEDPGSDLALRWLDFPPVDLEPAAVDHRATTTLLTREGTLVHQDRLRLRRPPRELTLELRPGSTLWSAAVDGEPVRPVVLGERVVVPLSARSPGAAGDLEVRLVTVEERALPDARATFSLDAPRLAVPVLVHQWRVLLPEDRRFRFAEGTLRPAFAGPADARPGSGRSFSRRSRGSTSPMPWGSLVVVTLAEDHSPLPGTSLTLTYPKGTVVQGVTGGQGLHRFPNLAAGTYRVRAHLEGFQDLTTRVDLRAAENATLIVELPLSAVAEEIMVMAQAEPASRLRRGVSGAAKRAPASPEVDAQSFDLADEIQELRQGLVGGVKPLPVEIPESGKLLLLTGVLPPPEVTVTLQSKPR